ncbi:MAG: hypothetical protein H6Q73_1208 [Firmicutes bacterium]|nr:hypothetical protein [Bacillota bacterium]
MVENCILELVLSNCLACSRCITTRPLFYEIGQSPAMMVHPVPLQYCHALTAARCSIYIAGELKHLCFDTVLPCCVLYMCRPVPGKSNPTDFK